MQSLQSRLRYLVDVPCDAHPPEQYPVPHSAKAARLVECNVPLAGCTATYIGYRGSDSNCSIRILNMVGPRKRNQLFIGVEQDMCWQSRGSDTHPADPLPSPSLPTMPLLFTHGNLSAVRQLHPPPRPPPRLLGRCFCSSPARQPCSDIETTVM